MVHTHLLLLGFPDIFSVFISNRLAVLVGPLAKRRIKNEKEENRRPSLPGMTLMLDA